MSELIEQTLPPERIAELRQLAEAAIAAKVAYDSAIAGSGGDVRLMGVRWSAAQSVYRAAASPDVVLALIGEVAACREQLGLALSDRERLYAECVQLHQRVDDAELGRGMRRATLTLRERDLAAANRRAEEAERERASLRRDYEAMRDAFNSATEHSLQFERERDAARAEAKALRGLLAEAVGRAVTDDEFGDRCVFCGATVDCAKASRGVEVEHYQDCLTIRTAAALRAASAEGQEAGDAD